MTQIPVDHVRVKGFRQSVQPLDDNQGPSQRHDHGLTYKSQFSSCCHHFYFRGVEGHGILDSVLVVPW